MADFEPDKRIEYFLAGEDLDPLTRLEMLLSGEEIEPHTRLEYYFAAMGGQSVELPEPKTRLELFAAKAAGMDVTTPDPDKRIEFLLSEWTGGATELTVSGNAPVTLVNAIAHAIVSLTQDGKVTQASTPTPSTPKDIVCNNGALKMVDDELPTGYKRVLGFTCDNNAVWEITNFHLKGSDTVRISFSVNAGCNVFGCYQGTDATDNYDLYVSTSSGSKYFRYGGGTYLSYWSPDDLGQRFDVVYTPNGSQGMPQDSTWSPLTFTSENNLLIGSTTLTGTSAKLKGNIYGNFVVDGRLKLIPCERVSDGVLGYYDTYSETFYEPYTGFTGAVSLGYDGSHYSLATVGTDEVITLCGKNLLNTATDTTGAYINQDGELVPGTAYRYSAIIPVSAGKYVVSGVCNPITGNSKRVHGYLNGVWQSQLNSAYIAKDAAYTIPITVPSGVNGIRLSYYTGDSDTMIEKGETATAYAPYAGQTASAVDLYAVGDYKDTQEVIGGTVTRKVGIKVLNGKESISGGQVIGSLINPRISISDAASGTQSVICTHFKDGTMTQDAVSLSSKKANFFVATADFPTNIAFGTWLAEQYAQGTPVIIVYPLATETTEQVTAQPLRTAEGTNTVSVTSNVDPVPITVVYKGTDDGGGSIGGDDDPGEVPMD